ncbi:MAG TPA: hypothetical protein VFK02_34685 [Kofleriaceae bacterium]|nr:hypothetical protein [Kofleriaceae bacterium]
MVFSRALNPKHTPDHEALTSAMASIGMGFAAAARTDANIEDTLLFASTEAMDRNDMRVTAMVVSWFGVHHEWVHSDRLTKLVSTHGSERVRALWSALARWQVRDRRYRRLALCYRGPRLDVLSAGTDFQVRRHGEDARFEGSELRVPANLLRDREVDVATPAQLAKQHRTYHFRVMMGTSYRADCWAALEADPCLSAAELARRTYAAFATAWLVKRDFSIVGHRRLLRARALPER